MIPGNLASVLANRKKYIEDISEVSLSTGQNNSNENDARKPLASAASFVPKSATGYTGLLNQGATCYLNSLLQSLFMFPEFREALFTMQSFDENKKPEQDLAKQLQILFSTLLLSSRGSVSTQALTKSFGWTSQDSFVQQVSFALISIVIHCHLFIPFKLGCSRMYGYYF